MMNFSWASIALLSCCLLLIALPNCAGERSLHTPEILGENSHSGIDQFEIERQEMVEYQIRDRGTQSGRTNTR